MEFSNAEFGVCLNGTGKSPGNTELYVFGHCLNILSKAPLIHISRWSSRMISGRVKFLVRNLKNRTRNPAVVLKKVGKRVL
jgi:hypothetical protein